MTTTTRNLILCIQFSLLATAVGTNELERYRVVIPGEDAVVMFKAESMGLRSTGGMVPRNWDVFVVPKNRNNRERITNMQFYDCAGLDISPDGSNIVFSAMQNQFPKDSFFDLRLAALKAINPDDKRFVAGTVILDNGKHNIDPRFSPDNSHVVFLSKSRRKRTLRELLTPFSGTVHFLWEVSVMDLHTLSLTVIDRSNNPIRGHDCSSDGRTIAYTKNGTVCHWSVEDIKPNEKQ
ncbi:MAG: hypothetical protein WC340_05980 [Kiritimatiellia bacterium]